MPTDVGRQVAREVLSRLPLGPQPRTGHEYRAGHRPAVTGPVSRRVRWLRCEAVGVPSLVVVEEVGASSLTRSADSRALDFCSQAASPALSLVANLPRGRANLVDDRLSVLFDRLLQALSALGLHLACRDEAGDDEPSAESDQAGGEGAALDALLDGVARAGCRAGHPVYGIVTAAHDPVLDGAQPTTDGRLAPFDDGRRADPVLQGVHAPCVSDCRVWAMSLLSSSVLVPMLRPP